MAEQDADPVDLVEGAPKRVFEFMAELYKVLRDQKQQELMQRQQQENQAALQKQQQDFMADQNERLMDTMKQAGIPQTDANKQAAKTGLNRLERLAEDEVQTQAKLDDIDKQIKGVDDEQRSLLAPEPDLAKVDERLGALDQQQKEANQLNELMENQIKTRPGITHEKRDADLAELAKKKEATDKAIKDERAGLEKIKADHSPVDVAELDSRLDALDTQQETADDMHQRAEQGLKNTPGITPEKLDEGLTDLNKKKAQIDKEIGQERAGLEKKKLQNLKPGQIDGELAKLDKAQNLADGLHKDKMEKLAGTPGMEPDKLFKGMEKLKAEKAEVDKGISQKREGLQKAKEPKLTAGQKAEKLGELHEKKAGLLKEKGGLQQKMQGIETEKTGIMQGKGMDLQQPKQGMGQGQKGAPKQQGPGVGSMMLDSLATPGMGGEMGLAGSLMMGGFNLMEKAINKPNSTAATLAKEMQASGKTNLGPKQSQKVGKGVR